MIRYTICTGPCCRPTCRREPPLAYQPPTVTCPYCRRKRSIDHESVCYKRPCATEATRIARRLGWHMAIGGAQ